MTDRHTSSSADATRADRSGTVTNDEQEKREKALEAISAYIADYLTDPITCSYNITNTIAPHISVKQHYYPSRYLFRNRYSTPALRNAIAHRTGPLTPGLAYDQLTLWGDQRELSDDFYTAVLKVLAEHRPDLFLQVAREILEMESDNPRKTRTYRILLESLAALEAKETDKASTPGADQNVDSPERSE